LDVGDPTKIGSSAVAIQSGEYNGKKFNYDYWNAKLIDYQTDLSLNSNGIDLTILNDGIYQITTPAGVTTLNVSASGNINKAVAILYKGKIEINTNIIANTGAIVILIAQDEIIIDHDVTTLHGFYIADGTISTDNDENNSNGEQLIVKGGLISWTGVNLWRVLSDNNNAGELFIQNNEMINALKTTTTDLKAFKFYQYTWKEVAP